MRTTDIPLTLTVVSRYNAWRARNIGGTDMELQPSDVEAKHFAVAKKGYDRDQVDDFLRLVGREMSGMQERTTIAVVRAEQLELKMHELRATTQSTGEIYEDALKVKRRIITEAEEEAAAIKAAAEHPPPAADPAAGAESAHAVVRSQQLIEEAMTKATAIEADAEAVLARALAASDRIAGETDEILAAARTEAEQVVVAARSEADDLANEARRERSDVHVSLLEEERELAERVHTLQESAAALESAAATARTTTGERDNEKPPPDDVPVTESSGVDNDTAVAVDVTEDEATVDLTEDAAPARRTSRYMSRSARLPRIGHDAEDVLGSMDSLRVRDDKK